MARIIDKTRSWMWWLAGLFCALIFGPAATAQEASVRYGIRPLPPVEGPVVNEEQKNKAEKLMADYLAPAAAAEPTPEQKAALEKLIKDFGSADFKVRDAASTEVVKQGGAALPLLREAAKNSDPEVATRAGAAVAAIEAAAHQGIVGELKNLGSAGRMAAMLKMREARAEQVKAMEASQKARDAGEEARAQAAAKVGAARAKVAALLALYEQLGMDKIVPTQIMIPPNAEAQ